MSTENLGRSGSKAIGDRSLDIRHRKSLERVRFIPGLRLSELFYHEVVSPILSSTFPNLLYSAALIGPGSEVLDFDTIESMDHHWGPRLQIFLTEDDHKTFANQIDKVLREKLPVQFRGFSTSFGPPDEKGVRLLQEVEKPPVNHLVEITTIRSFFKSILGTYPDHELSVDKWVTTPEQKLLSVTGGRVFHDGLAELIETRRRLAYYPRDIWLFLLASQWSKIAKEESFVGRTGTIGDEIGSHIIAMRLVESIMKLCFLMERRYAPYSKWFGKAFRKLSCAKKMTPVLTKITYGRSWREREKHLSQAYSILAEMHNALRITQPLDTIVSPYYNRPYLVIHAERFANEIRETITDREIREIAISASPVD